MRAGNEGQGERAMKPELPAEVRNAFVSIFTAAVKPERLDDFLAALEDALPHSAREDGVIRFEVFRSRDNPSAFTIVDLFRDRQAWDSHAGQPHVARLAAAFDGCFEGEPNLGLFTLHEGIPCKA